MSNYKCSKCGETADSKCAASRNVFPSDQLAATLTWTMKEEFKPVDRGTIEFHLIRREHSGDFPNGYELTEKEREEFMWELIQTIRTLPEETLRHWNCNHHWELQAETCSMGCCRRGQ